MESRDSTNSYKQHLATREWSSLFFGNNAKLHGFPNIFIVVIFFSSRTISRLKATSEALDACDVVPRL